MNVVNGTPPNFDEIVAVFPFASRKGVIFTYGDTVYVNGASSLLTPQLRAHEAVHVERQLKAGVRPWWERYLRDADYRLAEELPAHRAEYQAARRSDRNAAAMALHVAAQRLSSSLYGSMISFGQAKRAILA